MHHRSTAMLASFAVACCLTLVAGIKSNSGLPLGCGTAAPEDPFWMQEIQHQGIAAYNPNPRKYDVFRNVKVSKLLLQRKSNERRSSGFRGKRRWDD